LTNVTSFVLPATYDNAGENWKRPPRRAIGDRDAVRLYLAIGRALTFWEILEVSLGELFAILVETPSQAAPRAYGTLASAFARRDMLLVAGEVLFKYRKPDQVKYHVLDKLLKNYSEASSRRNDIAHGIVTDFTNNAGASIPGGYLVPAEYNSRRTGPRMMLEAISGGRQVVLGPQFFAVTRNQQFLRRTSYVYTSEDLEVFAEKFFDFASIVASFATHLRE
jgi:hypothetical protein